MKQFLNLILVLFLASCSKENAEVVEPIPVEEPGTSIQFNIQLDQQVDADSVTASFLLTGSGTSIVPRTIKLGKQGNGSAIWQSPEIVIARGSYTLQQVLVKHGDELVGVVPMQGSARSQQMAKPLPQSLFAQKSELQVLSLSAKTVGDTDGPAEFGYPSNSFPQGGVLVSPAALITVGHSTYPVPLEKIDVVSIFENGEEKTATVTLNEKASFYVSDQAKSYRFITKQWNLEMSREVSKDQLAQNAELVFEGSKAASVLLRDETYLEVEGAWMPRDKTFYTYRADGKLEEIVFFQKKPQVFELVQTFVDKARYSGNRLQEVKRFDGNNKQVGSTNYEYTGQALTHIIQTMYGMTTSSVLEPGAVPGGTVADVYIILSNSATVHYSATYENGNKVGYRATTSANKSEAGQFQFDNHINPYSAFMFPDMYLTHTSKNNIVGTSAGYSGAFPVATPYKYEYAYNADGYPTELITYYKGYTNDTPLYRTKKVFYYK